MCKHTHTWGSLRAEISKPDCKARHTTHTLRFYIDNYLEHDKSLPSLGMRDFTRRLFQHCPMLVSFGGNVEEYIKGFSQYKVGVPVYGCIILDPSLSHCLLVKVYRHALTHSHALSCTHTQLTHTEHTQHTNARSHTHAHTHIQSCGWVRSKNTAIRVPLSLSL